MPEPPHENPGTSPLPKKKRGPQSRDHVAAALNAGGLGLGSGRTWERCKRVVERAQVMKAQGYHQEAQVLLDALDVSKRGAYEIIRLSEETQLLLSQAVLRGEASNLIVARRLISFMVREQLEVEEEPITVTRCNNGMYRIPSRHNTSSVLLTAQDLLSLADLLLAHMSEFQEKAQQKASDDS